MIKLKVTSIGNSMGIVIPKEALNKMNVSKGDVLYLVENSDGFSLTPYQEDFKNQVDAAKDIMKRYRNTLRELAK